MIDLTPLDVRNKRGDFKKLMRGYDPQEVDVFLELVAERLEALVRENIQLRDRTSALQTQVEAQAGREQAVQDALVTAQELRKDIREQSQREADHMLREAESEARRMITEAEGEVRSRLRGVEHRMDESRDSLQELERRRQRFLQEFRGLLQRELDVVQVEEERAPLEERTVDLDLGNRGGSTATGSMGAGSVEEEDSLEADGASSGADEASSGVDEPPDEQASTVVEEVSPGGEDASPGGEQESVAEDASPGAHGGDAHDPYPEPESAGADGETDEAPAASVGELGSTDSDAEDGQQEEGRAESLLVDVADLGPKATDVADRPASPSSPSVGGEPSSLELELMASATTEAPSGDHPHVPDLETVLAEAGIDDVRPPAAEEISPPPVSPKPLRGEDRRPEDRLVFDKDKKGKQG